MVLYLCYACIRQAGYFTGIRTKRASHFRNELPGTSRATEIFWKYANYQLVSFLWHCARFYDRYCLLSPWFTLSGRFVPSSLTLCPGLQGCSSSFVRRVRLFVRRTCDNFTSFIFHFLFFLERTKRLVRL